MYIILRKLEKQLKVHHIAYFYFLTNFSVFSNISRLPWSIFQPDRDTNNNKQNLTTTPIKVANSWQLNIPNDYSNKFTDHLFNTLKKSIEQAAKCVQTYFDYPNELFHELHSHIVNCRRNAQSVQTNFLVDEILIKIQQIMQNAITDHQQTASSSPLLAQNTSAKHSPIILVGSEGTGKSTVLAQVYSQVDQWFESGKCFLIL